MTNGSVIFFFILGLFLLGLVAFLFDTIALNSKYYNKIVYGSDCTGVIPDGYEIVTNSDTGLFAVKVTTYGNYYLHNGSYGISPTFSTIQTPALFDTECEARAYMNAYIASIQPKIFNYK